MSALKASLPSNIEIIKRSQDNGTWPKNAIAVELKASTRWFVIIPCNDKQWDAMLIEPHSTWKRFMKRRMSTKEANSLLNKVLHDTTVYKDNSRDAHVHLIKSFIS